MFNSARNGLKKLGTLPYETFVLGCTTIGLVSGSLYGALETRKHSNTPILQTMSDVICSGLCGTVCGTVAGVVMPVLLPVVAVSGVITVGTYGYNKLNPVIPCHEKNNK